MGSNPRKNMEPKLDQIKKIYTNRQIRRPKNRKGAMKLKRKVYSLSIWWSKNKQLQMIMFLPLFLLLDLSG